MTEVWYMVYFSECGIILKSKDLRLRLVTPSRKLVSKH